MTAIKKTKAREVFEAAYEILSDVDLDESLWAVEITTLRKIVGKIKALTTPERSEE